MIFKGNTASEGKKIHIWDTLWAISGMPYVPNHFEVGYQD